MTAGCTAQPRCPPPRAETAAEAELTHDSRQDELLVLGYHAVSPRWPSALAAQPDHFERALTSLIRRGYAPMTFTAAVTGPAKSRRFAVTFDDGYASVLEHAQPILSQLSVPATVFLVSEAMDGGKNADWGPGVTRWRGTVHEPELQLMNWDDAASLQDRGWEIGSHTRSHRYLPALEPNSVERELQGSRRTIEDRLGKACQSISYPFGGVTPAVAEAAQRAGYLAGAAVNIHPATRWAWPRIDILRADSPARFRAKTSGAGEWLRAYQRSRLKTA